VIASQRKKRPTDFTKAKEEKKSSVCPFCPGNEHLTPPATLVYLREGNVIKKERDENTSHHKNWIVRCIPNLYPAFSPPQARKVKTNRNREYVSMMAAGYHEVLIESPNHNEHPGVARISQLIHIIHAYIDRLKAFLPLDYVKYVSIFKNYGADAGASLSHTHTQIITTPRVPNIIKEELTKSREYWKKNDECIFCDLLKKERKSERFIWENEGFIVIAPWAGVHPFEFWIFPKKHQSTILHMSENEIKSFAMAMRVSFGGLKALLNDPSYNFGFHMATKEYYHWHVEVYPRLTRGLEGFIKSTGIFINPMPPEEAAKNLKEAFKKEERDLNEGFSHF